MVRTIDAQRSGASLNSLSMNIKTFHSQSAWINATIRFIKSIHPRTIAISGGNTPRNIYKAMSKLSSVTTWGFYQVDERYVPKNHPDSNQKMIRATLKPKNFHYFDTSLQIQRAMEKYKKDLQKLPGWPKKTFDLCILGIGEDGHIASLFPNSKALTSKAKVTHTTTREFAIKDRLTITLPIILRSKNILVLLKNKPKILLELQAPKKSPQKFPALKLLKHKNFHIFSLQ